MSNDKDLKSVQGKVAAVSDSGIRIEDTWYNFSKYHKVDTTPKKGDIVELQVKGNFILGLTVIMHNDGDEDKPTDLQKPETYSSSNQYWQMKFDYETKVVHPQIVRMNALGHAIETLKSQNKPFSYEEIVKLAQKYELWVLQHTANKRAKQIDSRDEVIEKFLISDKPEWTYFWVAIKNLGYVNEKGQPDKNYVHAIAEALFPEQMQDKKNLTNLSKPQLNMLLEALYKEKKEV